MYHLDIYGLSSDSLDWISLGNRHDSPGKILVLIVFFRTSIIPVSYTHLRIGVKLSTLSQKQADYIGVPVEGPYKADHYRY